MEIDPDEPISSSTKQRCPVCREITTDPICHECGADALKIWQIIQSLDPIHFQVPSFWQLLTRRKFLFEEPSEAIWAELSPQYQQATLQRFRRHTRQAESVKVVALFVIITLALIGCICAGVAFARRMGVQGGKPVELFIGSCALIVLFPLRIVPLGIGVEELLQRHSRSVQDLNRAYQFPDLILTALMRRCPLPWYLNSNVMFPISEVTAAIIAWFVV